MKRAVWRSHVRACRGFSLPERNFHYICGSLLVRLQILCVFPASNNRGYQFPVCRLPCRQYTMQRGQNKNCCE